MKFERINGRWNLQGIPPGAWLQSIDEERRGCSDETAERYYRTAQEEDRRAQVGIVGGQVTLLGSVGLFIYDLRNGRGPENIPYPTRARSAAGGSIVGAGVRLSF